MELQRLIEELTVSKETQLDEIKCQELKSLCKQSIENVRKAFYITWTELEKKDSRKRLLCVQIIDILFCRSSVFRDLLIDQFQEFAKFTLGTNPKCFLPPPKLIASKLKQDSITIIKKWYDKFGSTYKTFELAYKFLIECKGIEFNDPAHSNQSRGLSEKEKKEIEKTVRLNMATGKWQELKDDMKTCITEIKGCFDLLIPMSSEFNIFTAEDFEKNNDNADDDGDDDGDGGDDDSYEAVSGDENEGTSSFSLRLHGLAARRIHLVIDIDDKELIKIKKSEDNAVILSSISEKLYILSENYLPSLKEILDLFDKFGSTSEDFTDAACLKTDAEVVLEKARRLDVQESEDESDHDDFVEVPPLEDNVPQSVISSKANRNSENILWHQSSEFMDPSLISMKKKSKAVVKKKNNNRNKRILKQLKSYSKFKH